MVPEEKPEQDMAIERRKRSFSNSGSGSVRGARGQPHSRSGSPSHQAPTQEVSSDQEPKLFIVNLADEVTEDELR